MIYYSSACVYEYLTQLQQIKQNYKTTSKQPSHMCMLVYPTYTNLNKNIVNHQRRVNQVISRHSVIKENTHIYIYIYTHTCIQPYTQCWLLFSLRLRFTHTQCFLSLSSELYFTLVGVHTAIYVSGSAQLEATWAKQLELDFAM